MVDINAPELGGRRLYIVETYSEQERRVLQGLKDRLELYPNLKEKFGEIVVPTEEVVELRSGKKRKLERKLFPRYLFVEMEMTDETWHLVKSVPGVINFVGGSRPSPVPEKEAEATLQRAHDKKPPRPKVAFVSGEVVRITEGPFADFNGVVEDVNYEKNRLRVSVLIFGRSTPVELEFTQVQKA